MAYARADAAAYLADEFSRYLNVAEITGMDQSGGVKTVIDRAFRTMGVARADLATASVADDAANGAERLLDKYMVQRLMKALGDLISISGNNPSASAQEQQAWEHLRDMLPKMEVDAAPYESSANSNSWQAPTYSDLQTYEPEWVTV